MAKTGKVHIGDVYDPCQCRGNLEAASVETIWGNGKKYIPSFLSCCCLFGSYCIEISGWGLKEGSPQVYKICGRMKELYDSKE